MGSHRVGHDYQEDTGQHTLRKEVAIINNKKSLCVCSFAQLCLTLYDSMDCSLPGSSVHGIFQARILEQVAISFFRRSFPPRELLLCLLLLVSFPVFYFLISNCGLFYFSLPGNFLLHLL